MNTINLINETTVEFSCLIWRLKCKILKSQWHIGGWELSTEDLIELETHWHLEEEEEEEEEGMEEVSKKFTVKGSQGVFWTEVY